MNKFTRCHKFARVATLTFAFLAHLPSSHAWRTNIGFFKVAEKRFVFTTMAQSWHPGVCSDIVTVQATSESGVAEVQGSDLTVNLSGAGLSFFSDRGCQDSITSITISTGSSSASFYYKPTTTGSLVVTASGSIYADGSQSATSTANPFLWTGGGANAFWNNGANWSGGSPPSTTSHVAVFDGSCVSNCSPNINTSVDIRGMLIESGYAGTITRTSGLSVTFRSAGWVQHGGAANFSVANHWFTNHGPFILTGGSFTGTAYATEYCSTASDRFLITGGTFTALNSVNQNLNCPVTVTGGTLDVGEAILSFRRGVNLVSPGVITGSIGGTFDLNPNAAGYTYSLDGANLGGLHIRGNSAVITGAFTVNGLLRLESFGIYTGTSTINAKGDINFTNVGVRAENMTIRVNGNSLQTLSGTEGGSPNIIFENTHGSNPGVILTGSIRLSHDYTVVNNNLDATALTLHMGHSWFTSRNPTYTFGSETYSGAVFRLPAGRVGTIGGTMKVSGNLEGRSGCCPVASLNGGTVQVSGNVTKPLFNNHHPSTAGGTATYEMIGSSDTTIGDSAQVTTFGFQSLSVNKSGAAKVTQIGNVTMNSAGSSMSLTAGTYEMAGFSLDIKGLALNGNTLYTGGGTLTVNGTVYAAAPGSYSLFGGTIVNP